MEGDAEIFERALAWRKQYLHLSNWWRNLQDQMPLRVREQYRIFAARMVKRYAVMIVEDFDMRQVVSAEDATANRYRQMVSPSKFRSVLVNACKREGVEVRTVSGAYTTATCHTCGAVEVWDQAASVMHQCGTCGSLWDQDRNAVINLLASGRVAERSVVGVDEGVVDRRSQSEGQAD